MAHPPASTVAWACLEQARAHQPEDRVPALMRVGTSSPQCIGSVARRHLPAVLAWPGWPHLGAPACMLTDAGLLLDPGHAEATEATLALLHQHLRERGLILGWRDELFPVHALQCDAPWADPACAQQPGLALARIERAAARFWGTLTFGAHCNGYVADAQGCPSHLWIGQRALNKATDPGRFDNLIGGGVPAGQTPHETLLREGWEEAGLAPEQLTQAHAGSVLAVLRDVPEGLQREHLHVYDLQLPRSVEPVNQDGEVSAFHRMTIQQALDCAAQGRMTVDAALATLDFALRHNLLGAHALSPAQHGLWLALRAG